LKLDGFLFEVQEFDVILQEEILFYSESLATLLLKIPKFGK
tara:strand:- start:1114 stop:1236 length:123 start_codon:yes stop_codon:yes gene_type:complete